MKKCKFFCVVCILLLSTLPILHANAAYNTILEDLQPRSEILLLQSLQDDTVIFDRNPTLRTPPASLTKLVTAILTLENCNDLEQLVAVPQSVIDGLIGTNSSNAGLKAGELVSVHDLLRCMLIPSANEAAATLAYFISDGNIDEFVQNMNVFASRLGCTDTHFMTPHGLDTEGQYTTAADIAKIMKYALTFSYSDIFSDILAQTSYTLPVSNLHDKPRTIRSTNYLMNTGYSDYYCKYVTGGKTGSTSQAGKCVAAVANHGGYAYLMIVMNAPSDDIDHDGYDENGAFTDSKLLLEWTYKNIRYEQVLSSSEVLAETRVRLSAKTDHVALLPSEDLFAFVPSGVDANSVLAKAVEDSMPSFVDAPIEKGDKIGEAAVYYADQEIARTDLVAAESISRNVFLFIGSLIVEALHHPVVRGVLFLLCLLIGGYIALVVRARRINRRNQKRRNSRSKVVNMKDFK